MVKECIIDLSNHLKIKLTDEKKRLNSLKELLPQTLGTKVYRAFNIVNRKRMQFMVSPPKELFLILHLIHLIQRSDLKFLKPVLMNQKEKARKCQAHQLLREVSCLTSKVLKLSFQALVLSITNRSLYIRSSCKISLSM